MKKKNKLLVSVSKYYITFVLVLLSIFIISYFFLGYTLSNSFKRNEVPIYDMINGNFNDIDNLKYEDIIEIGGYAEVLDKNRNVIRAYGENFKRRDKYTEEELLEALATNNRNNKYSAIINEGKYKGEKVTILIWLPKHQKEIAFTLPLYT